MKYLFLSVCVAFCLAGSVVYAADDGILTDEEFVLLAKSQEPAATSLYNKALSLEDQGERLAAIDTYKKAVALSPHLKEPYNNLAANYFELGMYDEAIEFSRQALSRDGSYASAWTNLAMALYAQNRFPEALDAFQHAVALEPHLRDVRYFLGRTYAHLKEHDKAIKEFLVVTHLDDEFYPAFYDLGCSYMIINKFDLAVVNFKRVLTLAPNHEQCQRIEQILKTISQLDTAKPSVRSSL